MSRHLYIAGVDRVGDLEKGSLRIEQALTFQIDTCSFSIKGEQPAEGEEVIIEDGSRLFAGIIVKVELARTFPSKTIKVWQVECDDYTALLDRRLVVETYENKPADWIFRDIAAKYCPGFTVEGVQSGAPAVEYIVFEYVRPSECFKQLCDYVGWQWQPDYYKDLQFFSAEELASPAPMVLRPGGKFRFGKHSIDTQGLRNRVYVRGGTMLSDPWTYEVKADGSARAWVLPHKPHDITVMVAGVAKTCGIENVHEESEYDFLMNYQGKYVRCSSQTPTPAEGVTLAFTYRYEIDVITMVEDIASQQAIAAVQGGDGIYEHVIVDDSLTTIDAAEAAGLADLREHANPRVEGSFETEVPGWAPGQLVTINLPDRGIQGTFLVQKVAITPCTPEKWSFKVEYGGRLLGIADWLQALWKAQQKKKLNETALLHKFHYGAETAKVADEIGPTIIHRIPALVLPAPSFARGSVAYKSDGVQVAANVPRFEPGKFAQAVMVEEGTTNLFPESLSREFNSAWTSGTLNGTYTVSVRAGTGKLVLSGGASGEVDVGGRLTVKVSNAAVTFTPSGGTPQQCQLEAKAYATSWIPGGSTRSRETLTIPTAGVLNPQEGAIEFWWNPLAKTPQTFPSLIATGRWTNPITQDWLAIHWGSGWSNANTVTFAMYNKNGTRNFSISVTPYPQPYTWYYVIAEWSFVTRIAKLIVYNPDGTYLSAKATIDGDPPTFEGWDKFYILQTWNNGADRANSLIDDLRISSRARTDAEIAAAYASGQPLPVDADTTYKLNFDNEIMDYVRTPLCGFVVCSA